MINLAVIELRDIIKYLVKIIIAVVAIAFFTRYFLNFRTKFENQATSLQNKSLLSCLDTVVPSIENMNPNQSKEEKEKVEPLKMALSVELGMMDTLKSKEEENNVQEQKEEELVEAQTGLKTEVQKSNVTPKYTVTYNSVKIKNETKIKLTDSILKPDVQINTKNILIYHTHSCESYTQSEKYTYTKSGNFRTTNKERSVIRVGTELTKYMKKYGYNVIHDMSLYDYPSYTGSYTRSYEGASKLLSENKGTEVVFDIHRDAIRR